MFGDHCSQKKSHDDFHSQFSVLRCFLLLQITFLFFSLSILAKRVWGKEVMERKQQQSSKEHHTSWETSDGCVRVRNFWSIKSNWYNFYVNLCRRRTTISTHQKTQNDGNPHQIQQKIFGTQSKRRTVTLRVPHSFRFAYKKTLINIHFDSFWAAIHKNRFLKPSFIHPIFQW